MALRCCSAEGRIAFQVAIPQRHVLHTLLLQCAVARVGSRTLQPNTVYSFAQSTAESRTLQPNTVYSIHGVCKHLHEVLHNMEVASPCRDVEGSYAMQRPLGQRRVPHLLSLHGQEVVAQNQWMQKTATTRAGCALSEHSRASMHLHEVLHHGKVPLPCCSVEGSEAFLLARSQRLVLHVLFLQCAVVCP